MNENFDEYRKEVYADIAGAFYNLRKKKGLTVEEVAAAAEMTPAKVDAIERGNLPHNVHHLVRLAEAMGAHLALVVKPDKSLNGWTANITETDDDERNTHCMMIDISI